VAFQVKEHGDGGFHSVFQNRKEFCMIPIHIQKILRFIPIVNFITVFCWIYACWRNNVKSVEFVKGWVVIMLFNIIISIPRILLADISTALWAEIICQFIIYLHLFSFAYVAVRAQEKIITQNCHSRD
jgi:hypothetical protein